MGKIVMVMHDALIIGGGPAGLSAAVYLGRFTRSVLVLDSGLGRSSFAQVNDNYLGFPNGITTRELRERGRQQAERFGVEFKECCVERLERAEGEGDEAFFRAHTTEGVFEGRTILFATGVTDIWPDVPGIRDWIGRQVYWCITCDGFRALDKRLVCIGNTDEAATTTLQCLLFTRDITLVVDPDKDRICTDKEQALAEQGIPVFYGRVERLEMSEAGDAITGVCLEDGTRIAGDMVFSLLGVRPNTQLAREMGVALDDDGYIIMDEEGYTSIPGVFAAGDLTRMYTQQVASAVHAGAEAAQTMNYYLYHPFQRNTGDEDAQERTVDPALCDPADESRGAPPDDR